MVDAFFLFFRQGVPCRKRFLNAEKRAQSHQRTAPVNQIDIVVDAAAVDDDGNPAGTMAVAIDPSSSNAISLSEMLHFLLVSPGIAPEMVHSIKWMEFFKGEQMNTKSLKFLFYEI